MHRTLICILFVHPISHTMKLMMYLGNDLIEAVPINVKDLKVPGYLGKFKRNLKTKYQELLKEAPEPPEFLVYNPAYKPEIAGKKD